MLRITMAALLAVGFLFGAYAAAEEGATDELGFREQMTVRTLTDRLKLSDEQKTKLETLLKDSKKETESKIRELLNDDQKKGYEEVLKESRERGGMMGGFGRRGGFGGREGRGGRGGPMGAFGGPGGMGQITRILDDMKEKLNLTEGQAERVQEILGEITEEASAKFMEELPKYMENGRPDWRKMMTEMRKDIEGYLDKAQERIKKVLKEDQIPKFEEMMAEFKEQINSSMAGRGDRGDRGRMDGERFRAGRLERIMGDLPGSAEEKAIIREMVEKILNAEGEWSGKIRDARRQLGEAADRTEATADEIQGKLKEVRELQKQYDDAVKALRDELRSILSFEQEAKLVVHRVLE